MCMCAFFQILLGTSLVLGTVATFHACNKGTYWVLTHFAELRLRIVTDAVYTQIIWLQPHAPWDICYTSCTIFLSAPVSEAGKDMPLRSPPSTCCPRKANSCCLYDSLISPGTSAGALGMHIRIVLQSCKQPTSFRQQVYSDMTGDFRHKFVDTETHRVFLTSTS